MIQKIGPYNIISKIASGGMASVYLASHKDTGAKVAIKLLKEELQDKEKITDRFTQEGLLKLDHPNIVKVLAVGTHSNTPYIVMDYIEGSDLEEVIKSKGRLPVEKALNIFTQILQALSYVHSKGVIHRDIKPKNILIDKEGNVKLTDFGIAKSLYSHIKTSTGGYLGAPAYSSPEQMDGKEVDIRSDIYSLGITLYEMLAGKVPFSSDSMPKLIKEKFSGNYPPITKYRRDIPDYLVYIIEKSIDSKSENRFKKVSNIENILNNKSYIKDTLIKKGSIEKKKPKQISRLKLAVSLVTVIAVLLLSTIAVQSYYLIKQNKQISDYISLFNQEESRAIEDKNNTVSDTTEDNNNSVEDGTNLTPIRIIDIIPSSYKVFAGEEVSLTIDYDCQDTSPTIRWQSDAGTITDTSTKKTMWTAPQEINTYDITVSIIDLNNQEDSKTISIAVVEKQEAPTIELIVKEGPTYSEGDGVCYYRVKAEVTGEPTPEIEWSKDDSSGYFGSHIAQINLNNSNETDTLIATATNSEGFATDKIELVWGCEDTNQIEKADNTNNNIVSIIEQEIYNSVVQDLNIYFNTGLINHKNNIHQANIRFYSNESFEYIISSIRNNISNTNLLTVENQSGYYDSGSSWVSYKIIIKYFDRDFNRYGNIYILDDPDHEEFLVIIVLNRSEVN